MNTIGETKKYIKPKLYVEHGDTAGDRNMGMTFPGFGRNKVRERLPRLNSDKSFVVSEQKDIPKRNKQMFKGGAYANPAFLIL